MIKAENIQKRYGELEVLKRVSLEISEGEIVSIVGASGAGKSTLLHIIGTLDKADSGMLSMKGIETGNLDASRPFFWWYASIILHL